MADMLQVELEFSRPAWKAVRKLKRNVKAKSFADLVRQALRLLHFVLFYRRQGYVPVMVREVNGQKEETFMPAEMLEATKEEKRSRVSFPLFAKIWNFVKLFF